MTNIPNQTRPNIVYTQSNGAASTSPFVWVYQTRDPNSNDVNYATQQYWLNTDNDNIWFLKNFTSSAGTVSANWLQLSSGTVPIESVTVDANTSPGTNPVLPDTSGAITVTGGQVAAGTTANVIQTDSLAANTYTIEIQRSQAVGVSTVADNGVCHFDSSAFSVDADGFVTLSGTGALETLTGNTGGAISPTANNINTVGTGSITIAGAGSTLTTQLTGLTDHAVLVGAGTATITNVGPTATAGQVLQSVGAAADPAFSTATYPTTTTINQILYSSAGDVVSGLATANSGVLTTSAAGVPVITALATDGQLIIGATAGAPAAATLTAGTNVTITNGANSITIDAGAQSQIVNYTQVTNGVSPYTVASTDYYLGCITSGGVITVKLPDAPTTGRIFAVKDTSGAAATSNITVTTVTGAVTIDGSTSYTMNVNYQAIDLIFNGSSYEVY